MQGNIKNNLILGNPSSKIIQVNDEIIRLQNEAVGSPDHWINDGLQAYFEETKRKIEEIRKKTK